MPFPSPKFTPNTTSKTQPMDHGVIRALKAYYRTKVVKRQIKCIDAGKEVVRANILDAIRMLVESWDDVSSTTVINCFKKAGISEETQTASIEDEDDPFKLLAENVVELILRGVVDDNFVVDDYVDVDFHVCTNETSTMTDKEIVAAVSGIEDRVDGEDEEDEESIVVEDEPPQKPSLADVGDAIELIESWSLFDVDGNEVRKSLNLIFKKLDKQLFASEKAKENQ